MDLEATDRIARTSMSGAWDNCFYFFYRARATILLLLMLLLLLPPLSLQPVQGGPCPFRAIVSAWLWETQQQQQQRVKLVCRLWPVCGK